MKTLRMLLAAVLLFVLASSVPSAQFTRAVPSIAGMWTRVDREGGGWVLSGDYLSLPINDEARARADAWIGSLVAVPERQCIMYTSFYLVVGPTALGISAETDPLSGEVVAWKETGSIDRLARTIWMDGRPHPSEFARHTPAGFSTGVWQGNTLFVHTTHLTAGVVSSNGVPSSSEATIDEYITRHEPTLLTTTLILNDPIYLEEPYSRTRVWGLNPNLQSVPQPCEPGIEVVRPGGTVPHFLPGTNPDLQDVVKNYKLPLEVVRGGAATTYPEYRDRLEALRSAPGAPK